MQGELGHSPSKRMPRLGENSQYANAQPLSGNRPQYCQVAFSWLFSRLLPRLSPQCSALATPLSNVTSPLPAQPLVSQHRRRFQPLAPVLSPPARRAPPPPSPCGCQAFQIREVRQSLFFFNFPFLKKKLRAGPVLGCRPGRKRAAANKSAGEENASAALRGAGGWARGWAAGCARG